MLSILPGQAATISVWDKLQHFGAYGGLMLLAGGSNTPSLLSRGGLLVGFSAVMELVQGVTPGRDPSLLDMVANSLGVLLGLLCWRAYLSFCGLADPKNSRRPPAARAD